MTIRALEEYEDRAAAVTGSYQTPGARRRILVAGTIGTAIEW